MKKILLISAIVFFLLNETYSQKNCDPISTFPWTESFEDNGTEIPPCWIQGRFLSGDWDGQEWNVVHNSTGPPPAAHHGNYKAFISLYCGSDSWHEQAIFTPVFDLSEVDDPVLSFCHLALGRAFLAVWYKNPSDLFWVPLQGFSYNIMDWQREIIPLPNKSNHYQIAFIGHHAGGGYGELHLDNISITDGEPELSVSSNFKDNFSVAPNPVHDFVTISGIHPQMVTLYDAQGRKILTKTDHTNRINMAHFLKGLYFLHIISDMGTVYVQKIIKH